MPLPPIVNPEPIVVAPVVQEEYPNKYIVKLEGLTPTGPEEARQNKQALLIGFRPYNYETSKLHPGSDKDTYHTIENIWDEAARVPLFAQAMGAIVTVAGLLDQEKYLVGKIADEGTSAEDKAAFEAQLVTIRSTLGITS